MLVEVKELDDVLSPVEALANAIGKYMLYRIVPDKTNSKLPLYLAISQQSFEGILSEQIGRWVIEVLNVPLIVFSAGSEEIIRWIP